MYHSTIRMVINFKTLQPDLKTQAMGPAKSVAFDAEGNPTKAGAGFARGQGVDVSDLKIVTESRGRKL